jgi:SAM-dependent methyltransferase
LRGDERLLEIGIGPGRDAIAFVDRGVTTIGVDLSPAFAIHATNVGAHVALGSARRLPFREAAFDAVWTMSTLMHIPNTAITAALAEIRRVVARGGVAAIGVWGGADVEDHLSGRYDPPRLFSRRTDDRWLAMLATVGTVEHFETWTDGEDPFHYQWARVRRT